LTTYITVCKNTILSNLKHGTKKPAIRVSRGKYGKPVRRHRFTAKGRVRVCANMTKPLPWGARVWLEVDEGGRK
jgi:hypothetical protein